jgi:type IX secretion system PorP/SprF family membrane protein
MDKGLLLKPFPVLAVLLILMTGSVFAQDPQFSQYYANPVALNPGLTGASEGPRIATGYRRQWASIPGAFRTFYFTYDQPIEIGKGLHGIGLSTMSDVAGEGSLTKTDILFNYAYNLPLNKSWKKFQHFIRLGIAGGIQQATVDFYKLRFPDQLDARNGVSFQTQEPQFSESRMIPDVGAGIVYYNDHMYVGFSASHITEPSQRFSPVQLSNIVTPNGRTVDTNPKLPMKTQFTAGVKLPIGPVHNREQYILTPVFIFKKQASFDQLDLGFYLTAEPMVFGLYYRGSNMKVDQGSRSYEISTFKSFGNEALVGLVGFKKGILSFGYSYDFTISQLTNQISGGSHELALILEFERNPKTKFKHRKMPCPRF